ncbi:MAG: peptidoglycan editing factor PgeF [bacterium]
MKRIQTRFAYYQFLSLQDHAGGLRHLVTTRIGGCSKTPYNTLNLGLHVGDAAGDVIGNRELVCAEIGYPLDAMVAMQQSHGARVRVIDAPDKGRGAREWGDGIEDTDGMITGTPHVILAGMSADCGVSLLYDPNERVIGVVHSGWKGIVSGVLRNAVGTMVDVFCCRRDDILACIAPTVCERCYEVGEDLVAAFEGAFPGRIDSLLAKTEKGSRSINMVQAMRMQFGDEGILQDRIEAAPLCTACRSDEFYSYRREHKETGRFGLFAVLV